MMFQEVVDDKLLFDLSSIGLLVSSRSGCSGVVVVFV